MTRPMAPARFSSLTEADTAPNVVVPPAPPRDAPWPPSPVPRRPTASVPTQRRVIQRPVTRQAPVSPPPVPRTSNTRTTPESPVAIWLSDRGRVAFLVGTLLLVMATVLLRLYHQTSSYELFIDEIQYADVGNSFAAGKGPELFGTPFFLHPPLFFALLGSVIGKPLAALTVPAVLSLRWVELFFAALNCLLVIGIARRVTRRRPALFAGALYAIDPFVIRFDSRLMLEAPAMSSALLGIFLTLLAAERHERVRQALLLGAGLAFGLAITTKTTAALVTTVPLLLVLATGAGLRRKEAVRLLGLQVAVYVVYVGWVALRGEYGTWFNQTLSGVQRATGVKVQTGFNSPHALTFADRALANLGQFGPSYLLILVAAGTLAVLLIEASGARVSTARHAQGTGAASTALLTYWLAGVYVSVAYTFAVAEIEEQTFYMVSVPSAIAIAMLVGRAASRRSAQVLVAVLLVSASAVWFVVHTQPDDAYQRLATYLDQHSTVHPSVIAAGEYTAQFVVPGVVERLTIASDGTVSLADEHSEVVLNRYAVVSTQLSAVGLAPVTPEQLDQLDRRYPMVFAASGRTVGELRLYDVGGGAGAGR